MISQSSCAGILERALNSGADFAELFFEDREELTIKFNQTVKSCVKTHVYGVGLYLISGLETLYTYSNDTSLESLKKLCDKATEELRSKSGPQKKNCRFTQREIKEPNPVVQYPSSVKYKPKIKLLENVHDACKGICNELKNLDLSYFDVDQKVVIVNSEDCWAEDRRVSSRVRLTPVLVNANDSLGYFNDFTRPKGFEAFDGGEYIDFAAATIKEMRSALYAQDAPGGVMPIVLDGGGCCGTFFHEACGHQFESQAILQKNDFTEKIGTQVATEKVTLIDDGTMPGSYGSSKFDDEGTPRQKNVLIENGIMKSYLCDRIGALRLNTASTGSGRRQGYAFAPAARMSNTYLDSGGDDPDEMIRSMPKGLYVTRIGGGNSGREFTLAAQIAYLIKNGQIDRQVKGATLLGKGSEALLKIDRVSSKLDLSDGGSFCGSVSGLCPVTSSGARMRVAEMLVGGKGEDK